MKIIRGQSGKWVNTEYFSHLTRFIIHGQIFIDIRASACDFKQCGMWDQQSLRSACAHKQSDQSLC